MGGPGSGRPKGSTVPQCDLRFRGEHYTNKTIMRGKLKPKLTIATEPTRTDEKGKGIFLCPRGWTEEKGFLTCAEAKARKLCIFKKQRGDNTAQNKKAERALENNLRVFYGLEPLEAES